MAADARAASPRPVTACLWALLLSSTAFAQGAPGPADGGAAASDSPSGHARGRGGFQITSSVSLRETYTDNVDLAPDETRRSDYITELLPAVQVRADGSRLKGTLAYTLDYLIYGRSTPRTETRNYLNANATLEAVERFLYVDGAANVTQETLNPFGPRQTQSATLTPNRTETRTYDVSPYARGSFRNIAADYELRYRRSATDSRPGDIGSTSFDQFSGYLDSNFGGPLGWRLSALNDTSRATGLQTTHLQKYMLQGRYLLTPDLRVEAIGGAERNDILTGRYDTTPNYGFSLVWKPSPRTSASGQWEHRFFGNSWSYILRYRLPRVAFNFTDRRDYTVEAHRRLQADAAGYARIYDALASRIPDPIERAAETQRILQQGAIPADLGVPLDYASAGSYVERRQDFSVGYLGVRNTVSLGAYRTKRDQIGLGTGIVDVTGGTTSVLDMGLTLVGSHRLTPLAALAASLTRSRTKAQDSSGIASNQWDTRVTYTTRLHRNAQFSLEGRHVAFDGDGTASDYRENAVTATVLVPF